MMKVILKLDYVDDKTKQKAIKKVSSLSGLESIALDPKDKKLTLTGDIDPITVVEKLAKICNTVIISVGPAKEPRKEDPNEKKKEEEKKVEALLNAHQAYYEQPVYYYQYHHQYQPPPYPTYYQRSVDENVKGCVIC